RTTPGRTELAPMADSTTLPGGHLASSPGRRAIMKHSASAVWEGGLKDGKGRISGGSGSFTDLPYSYGKRFEGTGSGTSPEELIGAAHSGCFSMALSGA